MVAKVTRVPTPDSPRCFEVSARATPFQHQVFRSGVCSSSLKRLHRSAGGTSATGLIAAY